MERFTNGNGLGRDIYISICEDYIKFYYVFEYDRHYEWLNKMEENCTEVQDYEKEPSTFYWIGVSDWVSDRVNRFDREDNFHTHMKKKNWFTNKMYEYINSQIK